MMPESGEASTKCASHRCVDGGEGWSAGEEAFDGADAGFCAFLEDACA